MSTEQPQEGGHKKPPIPTPAKKVPAYNIERRGDRLYQVQILHKWFAISSLLLFVFTIGMVLQDYTREWKRYQREFNQIAIRTTAQDAVAARDSIDTAKRDQLLRDIEAAEAAERENNARISELEETIASLNAQWIRADQDYRFTKAEYDAQRYDYEEALAHETSGVDAKKADLDETTQTMDEFFLQREQVNSQLQQAKDELANLRSKSTEGRTQIANMRAEFDRLVRQK